MSRRVVVNLVAFGIVFALLGVWAVRNVLHLDLVDKPYTVVAEFEHSPGLRRDVEVAYLGHRVGTVGAVDLRTGHVEVELRIDHDVELPAGVDAAVRRKSAVGEPYVDLSPGEAGTDGRLQAGDRIPVERTTTPLEYAELFSALADLVDAAPHDDLRTVVHELAVGLEGRGDDIATMVRSLADATGTFAERADVLDALASDLTRLTAVFAEHRGSLSSGVDDLAALAGTLAAARGDVEAMLAQEPSFTSRFATLLETSGDDLGCLVDALAPVGTRLTTEERLADIGALLDLGPEMLAAFRSVVDEEADGPYIRTIEPVNLGLPGTDPAVQYEVPPPHPVVPPLTGCPTAAAGGAAARPGDAGSGAGAGTPEGAPSEQAAPPAAPPAAPGAGPRPLGEPPADGGAGTWPYLLAAAFGGPLLLAGLAAWRDRRTTNRSNA